MTTVGTGREAVKPPPSRREAIRSARDPLLGGWKRWLLAVPLVLALVPLLVLPLLSIVRLSLDRRTVGIVTEGVWTLDNYVKFVTDAYMWEVMGRTLFIGLSTALVCLVIGFPYAFFITRRIAFKQLQVAALIAPLLVNMVVRVYGWQVILADSGLINSSLQSLGLIARPLSLLYNQFAVVVALVHVLLPFMVLNIYSILQTIDPSLEHAARGLGASRWQALRRISLPLARPGITAGFILVFTISAGSFLVPSVMGGGRVHTLATLTFQYTEVLNWPFASVIALLLMVVTVPPILYYQRRSLVNRAASR